MLLNSLEHVAYRLAGLTAVIWGLEKTKILRNVMGGAQNDVTLALKTSALLSGSEFLSDHLLSIVTNVKVPTLWTTINQLGMVFVSNSLVLLVLEKLKLDEYIVSNTGSDEMKAVQLSVLFIVVQEISMRFLKMYSTRLLNY